MSNETQYINELISQGLDTAIFDIDGTITHSHIGNLYLHIKKKDLGGKLKWKCWNVFFSLTKLPYFLMLDKIKRSLCQQRLYSLYAPYSDQTLELNAQDLFDRVLSKRFIKPTHDLVFHLKARGVKVILLTTNLDIVAQQYGDYFDVPIIAIPSNKLRDKSSLKSILESDLKAVNIESLLGNKTLGIGDSKYDCPVFDKVDHSIIVAKRKKPWMEKYKPLMISPLANLS